MKVPKYSTVDKFTDFKPFGRFTIRDDNKLVGAGVVSDFQEITFKE